MHKTASWVLSFVSVTAIFAEKKIDSNSILSDFRKLMAIYAEGNY
tara:strand:+ start:659 stop:793 length:135 start_codon:yes stop_codon:yes gene_type:complete